MRVCKSEVTDRSISQLSVLIEKVSFYRDHLHTGLYMSNMHDKHYYTEIHGQVSRVGFCWYLSPFLVFFQGNPETQKICLGESSLIEEDYKKKRDLKEWAGGGGGGGGATYIFRVRISSLHLTWAVPSRATSSHCQSWQMINSSFKKDYEKWILLFCLSLLLLFLSLFGFCLFSCLSLSISLFVFVTLTRLAGLVPQSLTAQMWELHQDPTLMLAAVLKKMSHKTLMFS